ncbi:MAG: C40 family peptidase [Pseudomonadota bacterium]
MELKARRGIVPMRRRPDAAAEMVTELLYGEGLHVERDAGDWLFGTCSHDGYQGWCEADRLAPGPAPSHRVIALRAFVYPEPDFKRPPLRAISFSGLVTVLGERGAFVEIDGGGWMASVALAPIDTRAPDWTGTALRFVGVPYLWGGRSSLGLDCSGLVQLSLAAAGIAAPRDSGDQSREVGRPIDPASGLQRGDVVFFPGHVALMVNAVDCVNASSDPMQVVEEPVAQLAARLEQREGQGIIGARRIDQ